MYIQRISRLLLSCGAAAWLFALLPLHFRSRQLLHEVGARSPAVGRTPRTGPSQIAPLAAGLRPGRRLRREHGEGPDQGGSGCVRKRLPRLHPVKSGEHLHQGCAGATGCGQYRPAVTFTRNQIVSLLFENDDGDGVVVRVRNAQVDGAHPELTGDFPGLAAERQRRRAARRAPHFRI